MASCMYRVGDYVYFEGNPTDPYLIRRIEELNKTPNGNVEARVVCFSRRRDITSHLVTHLDRFKLDLPWEEDDDEMAVDPSVANPPSTASEFNDVQKHQLRHRELFLTRQIETLLATNIRGKCLVTLHNETESFLSYLNSEDLFFYQLVYDPNQKTLHADRGEIRVGGKYQAEVSHQPLQIDETFPVKEDLIWETNNGLTEKQIEQYLIVARSIGTFARALDCPTALKHPSLHMSAASASRDATLFFAMNALHKHHYDLALATCSLVPNTGPILVKDQMEDWSAAEANSFEDAIEKCGKDFGEIQKEHLPWKSLKGIVEYYYMWKTTDRYGVQRRLKLAEQENKLKQVFIPNYNKAHPCLISSRSQHETTKPCDSCGSLSSSQWYQWQVQGRLCAECWIYFKKMAAMKYPKNNGPERRAESLEMVNASMVHQCPIKGCEKECKTRSSLQRHSIVSHGLVPHHQSTNPRHPFSLFASPLSRLIRPLCSLRRLARCSTFPLEMVDLRRQWLTERPNGDIRRTLTALEEAYRKKNEERREKHFVDLYPFEGENSFSLNFDDEQAEFDLRYPQQSKDVYATFLPTNTSLLKERPYETPEHSNEDSSPKRTLIVRQNLIKNKSPNPTKSVRPRPSTVPFVDPPDGIYLRVSKEIKRLRKEVPWKEIHRLARTPWKKLQSNSLSYLDEEIVVLD